MITLANVGLASFILCVFFTLWQARKSYDGTGQSITDSILEAWANIVVGFTFNYIANPFILPLVPSLGHNQIDPWENFMMGWIYTLVSVLRSFFIRRVFNGRQMSEVIKEKTVVAWKYITGLVGA